MAVFFVTQQTLVYEQKGHHVSTRIETKQTCMLFVVQVHKKKVLSQGEKVRISYIVMSIGRRPLFFLGFLNYLQRSFLLFLNDPQKPVFRTFLTIERGAPSC